MLYYVDFISLILTVWLNPDVPPKRYVLNPQALTRPVVAGQHSPQISAVAFLFSLLWVSVDVRLLWLWCDVLEFITEDFKLLKSLHEVCQKSWHYHLVFFAYPTRTDSSYSVFSGLYEPMKRLTWQLSRSFKFPFSFCMPSYSAPFPVPFTCSFTLSLCLSCFHSVYIVYL